MTWHAFRKFKSAILMRCRSRSRSSCRRRACSCRTTTSIRCPSTTGRSSGSVFAARLDIGLRPARRTLSRGCSRSATARACSCRRWRRRRRRALRRSISSAEPAGLRDALARLGVAPRELVQADVAVDAVRRRLLRRRGRLLHLRAPARRRARRARSARWRACSRPGGRLLVGCPAVHPLMNAAFAAIGFPGIDEHHFSGIADVARRRARPTSPSSAAPRCRRLLRRAAARLGALHAVLFARR